MGTNIERGIITYMYLENFVTYDKVVIRPGRNLNVIIGPNGTGKSTIVCAIVLGLGGRPSTIGRAPSVADYVKVGCDQAKIDIKLKESKDNDVTITRIFTKEGRTTWMIDGKTVNIKSVQELTKRFNVQVDNLCQFLPQDKIQDFSKLNPQELLENTERSVGDPQLYENHMKLKNFRNRHKDLETQIANKKRLLESKAQEKEGMKEIVDTIKERKRTKKKITTLKQKKAWILYDQTRKQLVTAKKQRDKIGAEKQSVEQRLKPINDSIQKIKTNIKTRENSIEDYNHKVQAKMEKVKKILNKALECESEITESEQACERKIEAEQNRDKEILSEQQNKSKLENDLSHRVQEIGSEETIKQQQQETLICIEKQRHAIDKLMHQNNTLKRKEECIVENIRGQEMEYQSTNIEAKRLELLRQRSHDAYKGVLWLRENKDKFSSKIHEPMLLCINMKGASNAKYLENVIPLRDLIAFVCEDKRDMNLLLQCLREKQNLQVNVLHSDPYKKVSMEPRIPLESIARFGFKNYLISLVEAPETIMKYLVTMYRINNIPVGSNRIEDNVDQIPRSLTYFFSENNVYAVNTSKYTGERSTRTSQIFSNGLLSIVLDKSKLQKIEKNIAHLKTERVNLINSMKQIEETIQKENAELDKYRSIRNKQQNDIQQIQALKTRIRIVAQNIETLENGRITVEQIKENQKAEVKRILRNQLQLLKEYNANQQDCTKFLASNDESKLAIKFLQESLINKMNASEDLKDFLKSIEKDYKELDKEFHIIKAEADSLYKDALESTGGISPQDAKFKSFNTAFSKLPATIYEIDNELQIAQTKVTCMGRNIDGETILRSYEELEHDIQDLEKFIQEKTTELGTMNQQIETLRDQWLQPLEQLVEQINENFSTYFAAMKCAGEVTLSHGENIMNFDQYGLKVSVKFRDADKLQELTRHHQSGGERAVATAIYMISLQELSRVPFRCVDEINQGMDAVNEKRVFDMLVNMTGRPGSSQYFLLTPKLVQGLTYSETVTVNCVFNGPFMIPYTDFNTEKYCKHVVKRYEKENN